MDDMDLLNQKPSEETVRLDPRLGEDVGENNSSFNFLNDDAVPAYTWHELFKNSSNEYTGFVESIETAFDVMKKYELETTTKFSSYKSDQTFGRRGKLYLGRAKGVNLMGTRTCPIHCKNEI